MGRKEVGRGMVLQKFVRSKESTSVQSRENSEINLDFWSCDH